MPTQGKLFANPSSIVNRSIMLFGRMSGNQDSKRSDSWKDDIDYSLGYNESIEDKFRASHDYEGLANYLSHFRKKDLQAQKEYEKEIADLRSYGRKYNALHTATDQIGSDAIAFLESFNSGSLEGLNDYNLYHENYKDVITKLGTSTEENAWKDIAFPTTSPYDTYLRRTKDNNNTNPVSSIKVSFSNKKKNYGLFGLDFLSSDDENENQFTKFCNDKGYNLGTIQNILGDNNIGITEGKRELTIPKSNLQAIKLLVDIREWCNDSGRNVDDVSYKSYDTNNNLVSDYTYGIGKDIQDISDLLSDAGNKKVMSKETLSGNEQIQSTVILGYMNERQKRLSMLADNGMISSSDCNAEIKRDNEYYETLLKGMSFAQLRIYTDYNNEVKGDETLIEMKDPNEKGEFKNYIRNAIRENRVTWQAATSGGEFGTYLTIAPEDDKGGLGFGSDDARRGTTVFIPGLFTESVQSAFDASTEGKTVKEMQNMQQYGYDYTLSNGNVIKNLGNYGAKLYDRNTGLTRDISREEAQKHINESFIVEDAVLGIRDRMFTIDGQIRNNYDYKAAAKSIAVTAANELYGGDFIDESDVWPSDEEKLKKESEGNIQLDYKSQQADIIYNEIINNIFLLLNETNSN